MLYVRSITLTALATLSLAFSILSTTSVASAASSPVDRGRLRAKLLAAGTRVYGTLIQDLTSAQRRAMCLRFSCTEKELARKVCEQELKATDWIKEISDADARRILAGNFDDAANRRKILKFLTRLTGPAAGHAAAVKAVAKRVQSGHFTGIELEFTALSLEGHVKVIENIERRMKRVEELQRRLDEIDGKKGRKYDDK